MNPHYNDWYFSSSKEWDAIKNRPGSYPLDPLYPIKYQKGTVHVVNSIAHDSCDRSEKARHDWIKLTIALETEFSSAKKRGKRSRDDFLNRLTRSELMNLQTAGLIKSASPYLKPRT